MLNKTFYHVQQISNDLKEVDPNSIVSKRKGNNSINNRLKEKINTIPEIWHSNQALLNSMNIIEVDMGKFSLDLRSYFLKYYEQTDDIIINFALKPYVDYRKFKFSSQESFIDHIKNFQSELDMERFKLAWNETTDHTFEKIRERYKTIQDVYEMMQYVVYENFKTAQYSDNKSVKLLLSDFVESIIEKDYLNLIQNITEESQSHISESVEKSQQALNDLMLAVKESSTSNINATHYTEKFRIIIDDEIEQIERYKSKILNQIIERRHALKDTFSLSSIIRKTIDSRRFIKK